MKIFIETERLLLREIVEEDAPGFYELDSDPEVHKYLGNKPVNNIEQSRDVIKHVRKQYVENGIGRWAIIDKATKEFIETFEFDGAIHNWYKLEKSTWEKEGRTA